MTTLQSNRTVLSPPRPPAAQRPAPRPDATEALRLRRSVPLLLLLGVSAVLCLVGLRVANRPAPHADVTLLPAACGSWVMLGSEKTAPNNLALPEDQAKTLDLDSYTNRDYVDRGAVRADPLKGRQVQMLLEYRRLGRGAFNHRPEACYPAAGYALSGLTTTPVEYGGQPAQALTCVADGDVAGRNGETVHSHQVLLYWFGTGRQMENSFLRQQVRMAFGRLQPDRNGWAFVRVLSECAPGDEARTLQAEKDFVQQASPAIIQSISSPADAR